MLLTYGFFLDSVANDEGKHIKYLQKADSIQTNLKASKLVTDEAKAKYGENSQTAVFVISGN